MLSSGTWVFFVSQSFMVVTIADVDVDADADVDADVFVIEDVSATVVEDEFGKQKDSLEGK